LLTTQGIEGVTSYALDHDGYRINLIDTPGFNDTDRSDTEVLQEVSYWLAESYSQTQKLVGIIYLQKINENRMGKSAMLNLAMFKQLFGEDCFRNIVLTSTMWSDREDQIALEERHEEELVRSNSFWGPLVRKRAQTRRYDGTYERSVSIISMLDHRLKIVQDIQRQMVDEGKTLAKTPAGRSLEEELKKERKNHQEELSNFQELLEESFWKSDEERAAALQQLINGRESQMQQVEDTRVRQQETFNQRMEKMRRQNEEARAAGR
jgi:hypothetical protein